MPRFLKMCFFVAFLTGVACAQLAESASPVVEPQRHYSVSLEKDLPLTFVSAFASIYGNYRLGKMHVQDPSEMKAVSDLLPWDRPVAGRYNKTAGDVTAVNVKAGDVVEAGTVLCTIDTKQVDTSKNAMDAAAVNMRQAKEELQRQSILYNGGRVHRSLQGQGQHRDSDRLE